MKGYNMTTVNNISMQQNVAFRGGAKQGKDILGKALDKATKRITKMDSSILPTQQMDVACNEAVEIIVGKGANALEKQMAKEALMGRVMADICNPIIKTPLTK